MSDIKTLMMMQQQIEVRKRDWPSVRVALVALQQEWTDYPGRVARVQVAIDKHDERDAIVTDPDEILAPIVGHGLIGQTRHHVTIDCTNNPAAAGLL